MAFKLEPKTPWYNPDNMNIPIYRRDIADGAIGKSNHTGIVVQQGLNPLVEKAVIAHETVHQKDPDLDYDRENFYYKGKTYPRKNLNEFNRNLPWEKKAYKESDKILKNNFNEVEMKEKFTMNGQHRGNSKPFAAMSKHGLIGPSMDGPSVPPPTKGTWAFASKNAKIEGIDLNALVKNRKEGDNQATINRLYSTESKPTKKTTIKKKITPVSSLSKVTTKAKKEEKGKSMTWSQKLLQEAKPIKDPTAKRNFLSARIRSSMTSGTLPSQTTNYDEKASGSMKHEYQNVYNEMQRQKAKGAQSTQRTLAMDKLFKKNWSNYDFKGTLEAAKSSNKKVSTKPAKKIETPKSTKEVRVV